MEDISPDKTEEAKKCLAAAKILKRQVAQLKALGLSGVESRLLQSSFAHIERLQSCLDGLLSEMQKNLGQSRDAKHKPSGSIKP